MSATVTWIGLAELRAALRRLPEDLAVQAGIRVRASAVSTAAAIQAAYPIGPDKGDYQGGNLRKGVRVKTEDGGRFGVRYVVRSNAAHAWLFEHGSQPRQNKRGSNRGVMPAADIFVPLVVRRREAMYEDLVTVIQEAGLGVRR